MLMKIEIRLADSGHSQIVTLQNSAKGETLINKIECMYKISPKDQILITKIGHTINPNQLLDKAFTQEMQDKTLVSSSFKEASQKSEPVSCVFLYNLKQLNKPDDILEEKSKNYWAGELKEKLFQLNDKSIIFPNEEELQRKYSPQQLIRYERFITKINSLRDSYKNLASQYSDLKDSSFKIQRIMERSSVQKKAGNTLMKNYKFNIDQLHDKLKDVMNSKEYLKSKFQIDDKSLRENSGFFESRKKNENSVALYEAQIISLKQKINVYLHKVKQQSRNLRNNFRVGGNMQMEFAKQNYKQRILKINNSYKNDYQEMISLFSQLVHSNVQTKNATIALETKILKLEENITKVLLPQYEKMCEELTNSFCEANRIIQINKLTIKQIFHSRNRIIADVDKFYNQLLLIENTVKSQIQKQKKRKISHFGSENTELANKSIQDLPLVRNQNRDEVQFARRVKFNKALNFIQSFATKMCFEEETHRKRYINELKNNKCEYQCLKNAKVREIDFDDNNTSDLELIKLVKASKVHDPLESQLSTEQFMLFNYNWILQKIKSANTNETNIKIKNMQQILKKMSDIFTKVYSNKIDEVINEKQQISSKIPQLQQKINSIQYSLGNSKAQILQLHKRLVEKEQLLISRQRQRSEQINKQRKRYQKLSIDFKELQKKLNKQMETTQELYNQVLKNDEELKNSSQLNDYLKELLAQKEIQIIQIQKKLAEKQIDSVQLIQPKIFKQNDLKSAVLHDFGKNISQDSQKQKQIQKLNQEIAILQRQNEELQQQFDSLQSQLRKIITKQTEDIEIQVNTLQPNYKNHQKDPITISQDISVGQNAIFMPFSSNLYVGVNHKDDNKTVCNINNIQSNNYLLDLSTFNLKTKELLSQCSFLVVLQVANLSKQGKNIMVRGQIKYLLGFQDDNLAIKNYTSMLPA